MTVTAIVVAGGRGVRFGGQKQFSKISDETVAARSVRLARSVASRVILVVPDDYKGSGEGADLTVLGGASRGDSVRCGLENCDGSEIVVVHDAARPMASESLFRSVVDAVKSGADAAVPGLAVTDTIKRVSPEGTDIVVEETVSRENLVTVQTPQAFRREVLVRAHEKSSDATDDAALVEALGGRVVVVPGEVQNIKITQPGDVERVETFVRSSL